jgi:type VI secretion system protein ImpM
MQAMSGVSAVGLYGKVASQPDFLRAGAGAFSQAGLDRWFQDGMEALRAERTTLPVAPTGFLLAPTESPVAFVGAFAPSADAAGRSFPLAVFTEISTQGLDEALPTLPAAFASFVNDAAALLSQRSELDGLAFTTRAQALSPRIIPPENAAWEDEPAPSLLAALGGSSPMLAYALRTLVLAVQQAAKASAAGANVLTVDAPAPTAAVRALWLEIARRRLGWRDAAPSLLWTDGAEGRLLMMLGPPAPTALAYLANPRHRSARLWPLRTTVTSAAEQALAALSPEQRRTVQDPNASLGDLASMFA